MYNKKKLNSNHSKATVQITLKIYRILRHNIHKIITKISKLLKKILMARKRFLSTTTNVNNKRRKGKKHGTCLILFNRASINKIKSRKLISTTIIKIILKLIRTMTGIRKILILIGTKKKIQRAIIVKFKRKTMMQTRSRIKRRRRIKIKVKMQIQMLMLIIQVNHNLRK